jgi:hypothetical protein
VQKKPKKLLCKQKAWSIFTTQKRAVMKLTLKLARIRSSREKGLGLILPGSFYRGKLNSEFYSPQKIFPNSFSG